MGSIRIGVTARAWLELGRVSNLPTVWSNTLAGAVLTAGPELPVANLLLAMFAMSAFYIAGMFLNDAFDADVDAGERPGRPIPSGRVGLKPVFAAGFGLLAAGVVLLGLGAKQAGGDVTLALSAGVALAGCIVLYDLKHKTWSVSPFIMGSCRLLVYVGAALTVAATPSGPTLAAGGALLAYVAGITFAARQETYDRLQAWWPLALLGVPLFVGLFMSAMRPVAVIPFAVFIIVQAVAVLQLRRRRSGDVSTAVALMIAAIALFDCVVLAGAGADRAAMLAFGAFLATVALQRRIAGT